MRLVYRVISFLGTAIYALFACTITSISSYSWAIGLVVILYISMLFAILLPDKYIYKAALFVKCIAWPSIFIGVAFNIYYLYDLLGDRSWLSSDYMQSAFFVSFLGILFLVVFPVFLIKHYSTLESVARLRTTSGGDTDV